jgi:hypothetical protein
MNGLQAGLIAALLGTSQQVVAQAEDHHQFDIPRQRLATALNLFARETGLQIARFSDAGEPTVSANPVVGAYTVAQALDILLAGSGFQYRFVNSHTIAIVKLPPAAQWTRTVSVLIRVSDCPLRLIGVSMRIWSTHGIFLKAARLRLPS